MSFEEEFPSIQTGYYNYDVKNISENDEPIKLVLKTYSERSITESCLDKQKVREAIKKVILSRSWPIVVNEDELEKQLLKELKL